LSKVTSSRALHNWLAGNDRNERVNTVNAVVPGQKEPRQCKQHGILIYFMAIILFSSPQVMINLVMNCSRQHHLCPTLPNLFIFTHIFFNLLNLLQIKGNHGVSKHLRQFFSFLIKRGTKLAFST
jgi:hypothetical protein